MQLRKNWIQSCFTYNLWKLHAGILGQSDVKKNFNYNYASDYRELNELRKPSSENPEILRFFKYMKAAKDGQDNQACELIFSSCVSQRSPDDSVPMMTTYNEINKLVQARNARILEESLAVAATDGKKMKSPIVVLDTSSDTTAKYVNTKLLKFKRIQYHTPAVLRSFV